MSEQETDNGAGEEAREAERAAAPEHAGADEAAPESAAEPRPEETAGGNAAETPAGEAAAEPGPEEPAGAAEEPRPEGAGAPADEAAIPPHLSAEELRRELFSARISIKRLKEEKNRLKAEEEKKLEAARQDKEALMRQYDEYRSNAAAEQDAKQKKLIETTQKKLAEAIEASRNEVKQIRARSEAEIAKAKSFALEGFVKDLIPSIEPLEKALFYADPGDERQRSLIEGLGMTMDLIVGALTRHGVEIVDPLNEPFDPNFHQAIQHLPDPAVPANRVMGVVQKGYVLNGRLLKPALVVVSSGPGR